METNNTDHVRALYNAVKETWPADDPWHNYTHNYVTQRCNCIWLHSVQGHLF